MVLGKLHDEGGDLAGEGAELLQDNAGQDDGEQPQEVEDGRDPPGCLVVAAGQGAEDERDDGQLGAAGDHGRRHDGHAAVLLVLDGLGGHDCGHTAAGGNEHWDEGFAGQTEAAEHAVHDEGDAGHVSAALQEAKQDEQHDQLRDEADDGAHAGDDAVQHERLHPGSGADGFKPAAHHDGHAHVVEAVVGRIGLLQLAGFEGSHALVGLEDALELLDGGLVLFGAGVEPAIAEQAVVGPVGHDGAHGGHRDVVHEEHDDDEDRDAQDAVGDHAVDLLGGGHGLRGLPHAGVTNLRDIVVTLVGDDGLGVVVLRIFQTLADGGDLRERGGRQVQRVDGELLAFQEFDGVPASMAALDGRAGHVDDLG